LKFFVTFALALQSKNLPLFNKKNLFLQMKNLKINPQNEKNKPYER